jgi:hypothetical protein
MTQPGAGSNANCRPARMRYAPPMSSVLDSPEVRAAVFPVSIEAYHQAAQLGLIDEEVELLDGIILKKVEISFA